MSNEPKKDEKRQSFLATFGRHLVVGSELLPKTEPAPPVEPAPGDVPPVEDEEAKKKAEAEKAAAEAKAAADKAAEEKKAAEEADKKAKAAAAEKSRSEPLPPIADDDIAKEPDPEPAARPPSALLDYTPTRAEVRHLEVLQSAAERDPAKYRPILDREVDRMKGVNKWVAEWKAEHPGEEPLDESGRPVPEYQRYLRANPPAIDKDELEDLRDEHLIEKGKQRAKQEIETEMEPRLREVTAIKVKPEIERAEALIESTILAALPALLPADDLLAEVAKDGIDELSKVPGEGRIIKQALVRGQEVVSEFIRLRRNLVAFDQNDPRHIFVGRAIETAAQVFEETGGKNRIDKQGRRFVSPRVFNSLKPEARKKAFTFTDAQIIETFADMTVRGAVANIEELRKEEQERVAFKNSRKPSGKPPEAAPAARAPAPEPAKSSPALSPSLSGPKPAPKHERFPKTKAALGIT